MRTTPLALVVVLLALSSNAARGADTPAPPATRPNVVVFVADDHGQDAGCYGNTVIKTPNIDALAADGVRYRNAFCTTASCSPSRSVLLTGLQNHLTGQYGLAHATHHMASFTSLYTLPAILSDNGYRTARIGKFHVAPDSVYRFDVTLPSAGGNRNGVQMADHCREFVADKGKPFFLYFCVSDPHRSGVVMRDKPGEPNAFGTGPAYPGVTETVYDPKDVIVPSWLPDNLPVRAELAMYYQAVTRLDQGVGRLVQQLKDAGQWDNTVFVYLSDNGAPMPGSKTTLYEPGMKLPLIVRVPPGLAGSPEAAGSTAAGVAAGKAVRGTVRDAMVSWVDLTPTVLDFAGVTEVLAPPLVQGEPEDAGAAAKNPRQAERRKQKVPYAFHGRSFRPTLTKDDPAGWSTVYASHQFHEITMYYPMRVVRTDRYKLIYNIAHPLPFPFASDLYESAVWQHALKDGGSTFGKRTMDAFVHRPKYELYDLQSDPDEINNLAADPKAKATFDELAAKLKDYQKKTRDPWVSKYVYE
jgi:N-sulfoglucosamine sulfohydrolase